MIDPSLDWEVDLPARGERSLSGRPPRATLRVSTSERGEERRQLPVAVGRRLARVLEGDGVQPASRAELLYLVGELERSCGHERVEALVGRRDFSTHELAERLSRDGYPGSVAEELVARASSCGLVDDGRYAAAFVRSKVAAGWGRAKIARELSRRGIEAEEVVGWPDEFFDAGEERARALDLASRRRLTGKNDFARTVRFLCGRGFSYGLAAEVAREVVGGRN